MANDNNSGLGVIVGILLAVVIVVGGYFFMQNRTEESRTTVNMPDVNIMAPAKDTTPAAP